MGEDGTNDDRGLSGFFTLATFLAGVPFEVGVCGHMLPPWGLLGDTPPMEAKLPVLLRCPRGLSPGENEILRARFGVEPPLTAGDIGGVVSLLYKSIVFV